MPVTIGGSGPITGVTSINTTVSDTELGYLDGVTSAIQSQINAKAADSSQGLYLITSQSLSAASSVSVNNCFTSTYDNYRIIVRVTARTSTPYAVRYRLRTSGTDSNSQYNQRITNNYGTTLTYETLSAATYWETQCANIGFAVVDVFSPALSVATTLNFATYSDPSSTGTFAVGAGGHNVGSAYDGITIFPDSGTISGSIRIYGLKN